MTITNIDKADYKVGESQREEPAWRQLDLSGAHLGVRVEELAPNGTSSHHHYHTAEEEHVLVLDGQATLHLGEETHPLVAGDHLCFAAGVPVPHHIENTSNAPLRFLVFGERRDDDVVFYPAGSVLLVKSNEGPKLYKYEEPGAEL
jgi:uncharacterized cupin superfamily protein